MLKILDKSKNTLRGLDTYQNLRIIKKLTLDDKSLEFNALIEDIDGIEPESYIETEDDVYVVKEIRPSYDGTAYVFAQLDVEELEGKIWSRFETVEQTLSSAMSLALSGTGWLCNVTGITKMRTLRKEKCTTYDIIKQALSTYRCEVSIDSKNKMLYFREQIGQDRGTYFTTELNLKRLSVSRTSYDFYTRIYPYGKDGMDIKSVNQAREYLENYQHSDKIIEKIWKDDRYTIPASLKEDAEAMLEDHSKPYTSYQADVVDLARMSQTYSNILDYDIGDTITLIDKTTGTREKQRIVEMVINPDAPELNTCVFANAVLSFEELSAKFSEAADTVSNITKDNGTIDGSKIGSLPDELLEDSDIIVNISGRLTAAEGNIGTLTVNVGNFEQITADHFTASDARIGQLEADYTNIVLADIGILNADYAKIRNLLAGSAASYDFEAIRLNAGNVVIEDAVIADAVIAYLNAEKVTAVKILTDYLQIGDSDGHFLINGQTLQISDDNSRVRVQIGKDRSEDYNMLLFNSRGEVIFNAAGITADGVPDGLIVDDMVANNAGIQGSKLNIDSVVTAINNGNTTINSAKIQIDDSTLSAAFTEITERVSTIEKRNISGRNMIVNTLYPSVSSEGDYPRLVEQTGTTELQYGAVPSTAEHGIRTTNTDNHRPFIQFGDGQSMSGLSQGVDYTISFDASFKLLSDRTSGSGSAFLIVTLISVETDGESVPISPDLYGQQFIVNGTPVTIDQSFVGEEIIVNGGDAVEIGSGMVGKRIMINGASVSSEIVGNIYELTEEVWGQQITADGLAWSFTVPDEIENAILSITVSPDLTSESDFGDMDFIEVRNLKLEKGSEATGWDPAPEDYITMIAEFGDQIDYIQDQIDGVVDQYYYDYEPTMSNAPASEWASSDYPAHRGDMFMDTSTGKVYRFLQDETTQQWGWLEIPDTAAAAAMQLAREAMDAADTKRRVFTTTPYAPYDTGDLWFEGSSGDIKTCVVSRASGNFNASDWQKLNKYTDDTAVDNLSFGGRNLLLDTAIEHSGMPDTESYILSDYAEDIMIGDRTSDYTLSFDYEYTGTVTGTAYIRTVVKGYTVTDHDIDVTEQSKSGHCSYVFKQNVTQASGLVNTVYATITGGRGGALKVSNVKLEKGNKASDWTPAPEDIEKRTTVLETDFTVIQGEVASKVSQSDYDVFVSQTGTSFQTISTQYADVVQNISGITTRIGDVETTLNGTTGTIGLVSRVQTVEDTAVSHTREISEVKSVLENVGGRNYFINTLLPDVSSADKMPRLIEQSADIVGQTGAVWSVAEHGIRSTNIGSYRPFIRFGSNSTSSATLCGLKPGVTYTVSFDTTFKLYSGYTGSVAQYYRFFLSTGKDGSTSWTDVSDIIYTITSDDKGVEKTVTGYSYTFTLASDDTRLYMMVAPAATTSSYYPAGDFIELRNLKIEEGSIATQWCPAYEDTESGFDSTTLRLNTLTQTLDGTVSTVAEIKNGANLVFNSTGNGGATDGWELVPTSSGYTINTSSQALDSYQNLSTALQTETHYNFRFKNSVTANSGTTTKNIYFQQTDAHLFPITPGETYTLSFWLNPGPSGTCQSGTAIYVCGSTAIDSKSGVGNLLTYSITSDGDTWRKVEQTFTVPANTSYKTAFIRIYHTGVSNASTGYRLHIADIMLNKGSTALAWVENSYSSNISIIKQTSNEIYAYADSIRLKATTLVWTASNSSMTANGTLTCNAGKIGGWDILYNKLSKTMTASGYEYEISMYAPTTPSESAAAFGVRRSSGNDSEWRFLVTYRGSLFCNSADITGKITATSGTIGGFTIDSNSIYSGTKGSGTSSGAITLSTSDFTRTIGGYSRSNLRFAIGSKFGIKSDGSILASEFKAIKGIDIYGGKLRVLTGDFDGAGISDIIFTVDGTGNYTYIEAPFIPVVTSGNNLVVGNYGYWSRISSSSKRYKDYLGPETAEDAEKLYDIPVVRYKYKDGYLDEEDKMVGKEMVGLFAEDVADQYYDAVYKKGDEIENYTDRQILVRLVKLVQMQHEEIERLKAARG